MGLVLGTQRMLPPILRQAVRIAGAVLRPRSREALGAGGRTVRASVEPHVACPARRPASASAVAGAGSSARATRSVDVGRGGGKSPGGRDTGRASRAHIARRPWGGGTTARPRLRATLRVADRSCRVAARAWGARRSRSARPASSGAGAPSRVAPGARCGRSGGARQRGWWLPCRLGCSPCSFARCGRSGDEVVELEGGQANVTGGTEAAVDGYRRGRGVRVHVAQPVARRWRRLLMATVGGVGVRVHAAQTALSQAASDGSSASVWRRRRDGCIVRSRKAAGGSEVYTMESAPTRVTIAGREYRVHPMRRCSLSFPPEEFSCLRDDIRVNGVQFPVVVCGEWFCDGRMRLSAWEELEVESSDARAGAGGPTLCGGCVGQRTSAGICRHHSGPFSGLGWPRRTESRWTTPRGS